MNGIGDQQFGGISNTWRALGAFVLAVVVAQLIFWAGLYPALFTRPDINDLAKIDIVKAAVADLPAPTLAAAEAATYTPVTLPYADCCDPSYLAMRMEFDLARVPEEGLGLINQQEVDNFILVVNGRIIKAEGAMEQGRQTFHGQTFTRSQIPSGVLREGRNAITYITVREGMPYSDFTVPALGGYQAVKDWAAKREWRRTVFPLLAGWTTVLIGIFAVFLATRGSDRRFGLWLLVLAWGWSGFALYSLWPEAPVSGTNRLIWFFAVNTLIPMALVGFIDAWTGRPWRWLTPAILAIYLGYLGWTAISLHTVPMSAGYDQPASMWRPYMMLFGALAIVRLAWHFASVRDPRAWEAAIFTVVATAIVIEGLGKYIGLKVGTFVSDATPLLLLALMAAFIQRNFTLFRSAESLNADLSARLAVREAELETAHARERAFIRVEAHNEERRRIMRDMHDGLGSQLMGMLLAARRGQAEPTKVAEGLQSVVDEMRLMIDSMDSVGESLGSALATFRARVQPRIEAAGFGLEWIDATGGQYPDYPPRSVLQVFRALQEAVTNALKHSGGDRLTITIEAGPDTLIITVQDNGKGVPASGADRPAGRGLTNMNLRIGSIGGSVTTGHRDGGFVRLTLPAQAALA